jgi:hypothetical protein
MVVLAATGCIAEEDTIAVILDRPRDNRASPGIDAGHAVDDGPLLDGGQASEVEPPSDGAPPNNDAGQATLDGGQAAVDGDIADRGQGADAGSFASDADVDRDAAILVPDRLRRRNPGWGHPPPPMHR